MSYMKKHIKTKINKIKKPKKLIIKRPVFWMAVFLFFIIFSALYIFIFSAKFQVKNVVVSGNEKIESADVQNFVFDRVNQKIFSIKKWNIYSKSFFLADTKKLRKDILNNFSTIESARITKRIPETITVEIIERKAFGAFCDTAVLSGIDNGLPIASEECFLIDRNGIVFEQLPEVSEDMIIMRKPLDIKQVLVGEKVIAENIMAAILKIEKNLKDNLQIDIKEAVVSNPLRLNIKTNENWEIYFNLESDIDMQITKINLLLSGEIPPEVRRSLQYIDLRFKDKAYYK